MQFDEAALLFLLGPQLQPALLGLPSPQDLQLRGQSVNKSPDFMSPSRDNTQHNDTQMWNAAASNLTVRCSKMSCCHGRSPLVKKDIMNVHVQHLSDHISISQQPL